MAGHPKDVVFLTCDAFGVLPPLSRLTPEQAAYHFISGYTAKVAGTEIGITEPQATFSTCFGAPFMPRHPSIYADLLSRKIREHNANCWLINTGWVAGGYGESSRIRIKWTRSLLNAALDGSLDDVIFVEDERFGFQILLLVKVYLMKFFSLDKLGLIRKDLIMLQIYLPKCSSKISNNIQMVVVKKCFLHLQKY